MDPTSTLTINDLFTVSDVRAWASNGTARRTRKAAGVTVTEVARALGVDPSTVSLWENGRRIPRTDVALRWAALLDEMRRRAPATQAA